MTSLVPSDLTEVKKSGSGNRPSLSHWPPKNGTEFWTVRIFFGIKKTPRKKRILVYRCSHWIALALSFNLGQQSTLWSKNWPRTSVFRGPSCAAIPVKTPKVAKVVNFHQPSTPKDNISLKVIDDVDVLVYKNSRLVVPAALTEKVVMLYHHYLQHPGHTRLELTIAATLYW